MNSSDSLESSEELLFDPDRRLNLSEGSGIWLDDALPRPKLSATSSAQKCSENEGSRCVDLRGCTGGNSASRASGLNSPFVNFKWSGKGAGSCPPYCEGAGRSAHLPGISRERDRRTRWGACVTIILPLNRFSFGAECSCEGFAGLGSGIRDMVLQKSMRKGREVVKEGCRNIPEDSGWSWMKEERELQRRLGFYSTTVAWEICSRMRVVIIDSPRN